MLNCGQRAIVMTRSGRSYLGTSLMRLQHHAEPEHDRSAECAEDALQVWQEKWSNRREQIALRLSLIDAQLEKLVPASHDREMPQLLLVGHGAE